MNETELFRGGRSASLFPTREDKRHEWVTQSIMNEAREVALKGDASAALIGRSMEHIVDLYKYGQSLAGEDPMLQGAMNRLVADYMTSAERRQRAFDGGFKL